MSLGGKLYDLRKKKGLTQEQAAEKLGVTRQTISKWETDQSTPDFDKLVSISWLYEISLDDLAENGYKNSEPEEPTSAFSVFHYEYKSTRSLFGLPLLHVNVGRGLCRAKGIVAVGNIAVGVVSLGVVSMGILSFGALALGILVFGGLAAGGAALGGVAAGILSFGGVAVGAMAIGGLAIGVYAIGGCAVASHVALGGYAQGTVAIGESARGAIAFLTGQNLQGLDTAVREAILSYDPNILKPILELFVFFVRG